ncbi:MAG: hypothetical protein ACFCBU_15980 [Cyanophyceae cyanobacterium]
MGVFWFFADKYCSVPLDLRLAAGRGDSRLGWQFKNTVWKWGWWMGDRQGYHR